MTRRFPAEWEEQDGVLLAWPHEATDWRLHLDVVEPVFIEIVRSISRFERVLLVVADEPEVERQLTDAGVDMANIRLFPVESNDTWARDFGPVTVMEEGKPLLLDFGFNGWGLKFRADLDNQITRRLAAQGAFGKTRMETKGIVLEGGSIESDGQGTILTTSACLLSPNRNPHLSRGAVEELFLREFGARRVLWLENGRIRGDDTDSHVDTLARLCPDGVIVYTTCADPKDEHYDPLRKMEEEIRELRTAQGKPYRLLGLPLPEAIYDEEDRRLAATYANFLVINDAVLVPLYGGHGDRTALEVIGLAFPGRRIEGVDCLPLLSGNGSLHCITMQLPKGVTG